MIYIYQIQEIISFDCGSNLKCILNDDTGDLTISGSGNLSSRIKYSQYIKSVIIEEGVTSIGERAFSDCSSLTSIEIPNSVTSIESRAFYNCDSLTSITIPDSVTSIGEWAFFGCSSLTSITIPNFIDTIKERTFSGCSSLASIIIPNSVKSIGSTAFSNCRSLTSVEIGNSVTSIGDYAFSGCSSLTLITIPDSVTSIGNRAFSSCYSLTSITIPDNVKSIGERTFSDCNSLASVTIPNSVTSIGGYAFYSCSSLTSITIPDSVLSIKREAFSGCSSLSSIAIGNSVTSIEDRAFDGCSSLTSITIPNSVTSIGDNVFVNCKSLISIIISDNAISLGGGVFTNCISLTSIIIPNTVKSIGKNAFEGCSDLTSITVNSENQNYSSIDGVLFNKNKSLLIKYPSGNKNLLYIIPDSVTSIGERAFFGCSSLTSITLGNSVTSIGESAFQGCSSLTSISIQDSVESIGSSAFSDCSSLTSIVIPDSVTSIGSSAFSGCSSLTSIVIPDSLTFIEYGVFSGCSSLTSITIPNKVTSISNWAFSNCRSLTSITIPNSVINIGGWTFSDCNSLVSVTIPNSVDSIGYRAFDSCSSLTSITIPDSVTSIGEGAFLGCSSLTSITVNSENQNYSSIDGVLFNKNKSLLIKYPPANIRSSYVIPDTVNTIEDTAFHGCKYLSKITIPDFVKSIGDSAFSACNSLTSITIPDSVTSIRYNAFSDCNSLTSVTLGNSVNEIGEYAFSHCNSLTSITIGNSVKSIKGYAFYDCISLVSITIPDSVTSIGGYAFSGCSSLTSIIIPNSVTQIKSNAFSGCTSLTSIEIGNSVSEIEDRVFYGCNSLTSIIVDKNNPYYLSDNGILFNKDKTLLKIYPPGKTESDYIIPNTVTSIGMYAFGGCKNLSSITIPNSVTSIGYIAFSGCSSLTSITIPNSVTSIGNSAFDNCSALTSINVSSENSIYSSINGVLFNKDGTYLIEYPPAYTESSYTIPSSVTVINDIAFTGCNTLVSITIPSSVTFIGEMRGNMAFYNCRALSSIIVDSENSKYSSINGVLFNKDGTRLIRYPSAIPTSSYVISNRVKSIEYYAFEGCTYLTSIKIPSSVTSIEDGIFKNCSSLEKVYFYGKRDLMTYENSVFLNTKVNKINVPIDYKSNKFCRMDVVKSIDIETNEDNEYYYSENKLYKYNKGDPKIILNPLPGFYFREESENDKDIIVQCTIKECKIMTEISSSCNAENDGKIILEKDHYELCTKVNEYDYTKNKTNEKYVGIKFENQESREKRFIVHHAGEVFNFERKNNNNYYVVKSNVNSIVFDPSFKVSGNSKVIDYCATKDGLLINRKTDFCSHESSGMYYNCNYGKCTSISMLNGIEEKNNEFECNCASGKSSASCTKHGYYLESNKLYNFSNSDCTEISHTYASIGYYWNEYQYNDISQCDGKNLCEIYEAPIELTSECTNNANKIIDNGYSLLFCKDSSTPVVINSIENSNIVVKGVEETLFPSPSRYYVLKKDATSLILDTSKNGNGIAINEVIYDCIKGVCYLSGCKPNSTNNDERRGCNGYYLSDNKLYRCSKDDNNDTVNCTKETKMGYFKNKSNGSYIKCSSTKDGDITCESLTTPESNHITCAEGNIIYGGKEKVKLCPTTDPTKAFYIFENEKKLFLLKAGLLDKSITDDEKYFVLNVESEDSAVIDNLDESKHFLYTFNNQEVVDSVNSCESSQFNSLMEYEKDENSNIYTKETTENN